MLPCNQAQQEEELMELQSWLGELTLSVHHWLYSRGLVVLVVCFSKSLFEIELVLAVCNGRQSLLHAFLKRLNWQQRGNQLLIPAHFQERSSNHYNVLLFNILPTNHVFAIILVLMNVLGEQALQLR